MNNIFNGEPFLQTDQRKSAGDSRYQLVEFTSATLKSAAYDSTIQRLTITFNNGSQYYYAGVPQDVATELFTAQSAGKYFYRHIKGQYTYSAIESKGNEHG